MELKDISGNIIYGGKDDTIKLLETIAEAIIHGGISIDDVRVTDFSKEIEKIGCNATEVNKQWKKISFCYRLEKKE